MKNLIIVLLVVTAGSTGAKAQLIKNSPLQSVLQKPKSNTGSTQQTTTATVNDADYFLSVAKVTIKTGKDNKELNSKLYVSVYPASGTDNYKKGFTLDSYMPELKTWSSQDF
ncbi:MAG: hypothetical protein QM564_12760, partial [Bergeyella sp.]